MAASLFDIQHASALERYSNRNRRFFSSDYVQIPLKGVCIQCQGEFCMSITVSVESLEEMDALREAIGEDRRRGNPRPNGHELLKEIRRKTAEH
jgi:hypothetical protein